MNDKSKAIFGRSVRSARRRLLGRYASTMGRSPKRVRIEVQGKRVFVGPSIAGKPMRLIEVTSGEVEDRKPLFI